MQRIHGWLDQLTLRRSRRRGQNQKERRNASVAPSCRLNSEKSTTTSLTQARPKKLVAVNVPFIFPPPPTEPPACMTSSCTRRRGIRTNPWLYMDQNQSMNDSYTSASTAFSLDRRRPPPPTLGVKSLEESICSSGYGSQDCSPDSSIHLPSWNSTGGSPRNTWQTSSPNPSLNQNDGMDDGCFLEDTSSFGTYDNICDEHIYHELEMICRRPDRSYSSDCLSSSEQESPLPSRESPIYAQPWVHYPSFRPPFPKPTSHAPVSLTSTFKPPGLQSFKQTNNQLNSFGVMQSAAPRRMLPCRPTSPIYATPYIGPMARPYVEEFGEKANSFIYPKNYYNCLDSAPHPTDGPRNMEEAEEEFLEELDAQINELQQRSDELRHLVERARVRRGTNHSTKWSRPVLECTFELEL
ncbi:unnamed protein product [Auanema sp. JU1783]|nr:unnamed protein product [Auanema sp. JU1783]